MGDFVVSVKVDVSQIAAVKNFTRQQAAKASREAAELVLERVKQRVPVSDRPLEDRSPPQDRHLRDTYRIERISDMVYQVGTDDKRGLWIEFGTSPPPDIVYPVEHSVLRFEVNGEVVYAPYVRFVGQKPQPVLGPAFDSSVNDIRDIYFDNLSALDKIRLAPSHLLHLIKNRKRLAKVAVGTAIVTVIGADITGST